MTFARQKILCEPENIGLLRTAICLTQTRHPFVIDAFVLLPDYLNTLWTPPLDAMDYSMRWHTKKAIFPNTA
jgi:putative transposase